MRGWQAGRLARGDRWKRMRGRFKVVEQDPGNLDFQWHTQCCQSCAFASDLLVRAYWEQTTWNLIGWTPSHPTNGAGEDRCRLFVVGRRFCLFLLSLLWPAVRSKRIGIRGAHFRQGVSAPSNLELVRKGFLLRFDWLFFFPRLPCLCRQGQEDWVSPSRASTWLVGLNAFTWFECFHNLVEGSWGDVSKGLGGYPWPKTLPQGQSDLRRSFHSYKFFEDLILWLPGFPLVVIMFNCWLAGATFLLHCLQISFDCFEPTQTWYLSDALKGWLFVLVVDRVFFISIFLIFSWNIVNLLVNHQNLEKVCKYLCNIWESV